MIQQRFCNIKLQFHLTLVHPRKLRQERYLSDKIPTLPLQLNALQKQFEVFIQRTLRSLWRATETIKPITQGACGSSNVQKHHPSFYQYAPLSAISRFYSPCEFLSCLGLLCT